MITKGQNLRVFVDGNVVAKATSCTITESNSMEDTSTKDDTGLFTKETVASKNWSVQVESLNELDIATMITNFKNRKVFAIMWDGTEGEGNASEQDQAYHRHGNAFLTDATFTFNDRTVVSKNLQFTGTGEVSDSIN